MSALLNKLVPSLAEREARRTATEESIRMLWKEEPIDLEELISLEDAARKRVLTSVPESERVPVSAPPEASEDYLVFIDRDLDLDYITDQPLQGQSALVAEICSVENLPCKHLPKSEVIAFKRILGGALTCAIEGSDEQARVQVKKAKDYLSKRVTERSRQWNLLCCLPVVSLMAWLAYKHPGLLDLSVGDSQYSSWLIAAFFGTLGAFVSMVQKSGSRELDSASGFWLHLIETYIRFFSGAISGVVLVALCSSALAPEVFEAVLPSAAGTQVLGFIAGFSDRLIPSIVSKYQPERESE